MRTRPVLLLCVCFAAVQHRADTGTASVLTPDDASGGCTERLANVNDVTGVAVDCSRGNFSAVPTNISSLSVVLDLKCNRLRSVNRDSFTGLVSLKISTIEHGSFTDLSELFELYLDHNDISSAANNIFQGLSRYSSDDSDWVIRSLVPHLDSLQVESCIANRDFIPGIPVADNIVHSIEESQQVILVISENFLKSDWCKFELSMAEYKHFTTGEKYVIPILLEEIPIEMMPKSLRYLLATKTYLEWKDGEKQEGLFWRRLGKALKSSKSGSQRQERIPIKQTGDIEEDVVARSSLSPITSPMHVSDTDDDVDVEQETQVDNETCVTLDNSLKETCTDDQAIDITAEGPHIDEDPSSDCQTVCSDVYTENPGVEDVKLMTKAKRRDLATFFAGIVEKGRHVFFTTLFRFKYTKTSSFHHKVPPMSDSEATAEPFLPNVVQESYTEEHAHVACCHQEPIYQNSWFLYHATRIRTKEPLPPVPVEQDDTNTSLTISEPQTTIVHMAAIEQYQSPMPVYEEIPCHRSERSLVPYGAVQQQPRLNVVTSFLATGIFDSEGGHLVIEGTGVRLFIPPGAINDGAEQQVTISISSEECDKPTLAEGQARISPVIRCSPHGITFQKSVALSFPHTGETSKGKAIRPVITNTDRGHEAGYEDMRKDHGARAIVRKSDCVVFLDHFTGVTLVEESPCPDEGAKGVSGSDDSTDKPLYAIPFWTLTSSGDVVVRVRLCQKRDDAKQTAYEDEQACGGRPCDGPPVTLYVQVRNGTKARVQLVMDNVRPGWASVDGLEKVIDCRRIFTDDEVQQCSFLLERCSDGDGHNSNRFRCRLQFIPEGNEDAQTTYVSVLTDEPPPLSPKQDFAVRPKRPPCLPAGTRKELCRLLDPSNPRGNDWRMLSCELNLQLDSFDIQLFKEHSDKRSPTFQILTLFELDYGHLPQVQQLHALRKVLANPPMGRPDASRLVENVISQHFAEDGATPSVAHDHDQHCDPAASNTMSRLTGDRYYSPYAAPCAVQPKILTATNMHPDTLTNSSTANTQLDDAPEETTLKKTHLPETDSEQACKQESQSCTAVSLPLKVPDRNASLATSQVEDTPSHTGATASTKRMQGTKLDDEMIIVEEERIRSEDDVDLLSSEDAPNLTDDKKLKKKQDVVDTHTFCEECLTKSSTGMHLSNEEESVSLLDETDS
ncbi:toll-like receptor 6 signaling pathway [Branchiostoma belcheri]|nr:toll-like receptor 6 signaling pathway [Branchiostoma belcheri]